MDAPFEQTRTATAFRLIDATLRRGLGARVFAYEGAVSLSMTTQKPHANAVHGRTLEEEAHPTPHILVNASRNWRRNVAHTSNGSTAACAWTSAGQAMWSPACGAVARPISGR